MEMMSIWSTIWWVPIFSNIKGQKQRKLTVFVHLLCDVLCISTVPTAISLRGACEFYLVFNVVFFLLLFFLLLSSYHQLYQFYHVSFLVFDFMSVSIVPVRSCCSCDDLCSVSAGCTTNCPIGDNKVSLTLYQVILWKAVPPTPMPFGIFLQTST